MEVCQSSQRRPANCYIYLFIERIYKYILYLEYYYLISELASSIVATQLLRINCLAFFSPAIPVNIFIGSAITVTQCINRNCAILTVGFLCWLQLAIDFMEYNGGMLITILSSAQFASMRMFWFLSAVRFISPVTMLSNNFVHNCKKIIIGQF